VELLPPGSPCSIALTMPAGTSVAVQVNAVDAVSNAGPTTSTTVVVVDAPPTATSTFEGFDDTAPSTLSALAATHLVTCPIRVPPGSTQPFVADLEGELDVAIKGAVEGWCQPADFSDPESVAAAEKATLRLAICVQVEDGASWRSLKCDAGKLTGTSPNLHLNVNAAPLCEPGSPRYRLVVTDSVTGDRSPRSGTRATSTPRSLPCNEAGAWRRTAARDPGTSNQVLAAALRAPDSPDPLPQGDPSLGSQGGWEAHHIVPAGEGRGTEGTSTAASNLAQARTTTPRITATSPTS
jgi:hypothetical protein